MSSSINNTYPQVPLEIPKSLQKSSALIIEPVSPLQTVKPALPSGTPLDQ
jgi:hypothetical protein